MKRKNLIAVVAGFALTCAVAGGVTTLNTASVTADSSTIFVVDGTEFDMTSFVTNHKAAIRYDTQVDEKTGVEYTGMRFLTGIDPEVHENLNALTESGYTVSFGTIVANYDTMKDLTDFTMEYLPENTAERTYYLNVPAKAWVESSNKEMATDEGYVWSSKDQYSAVLYGITEENYDVERIARGYVKVTKEGETQIYYASYKGESRSVADVAMYALQAKGYKTEKEDATESEFKALNKYAKKSDIWKEKYAADNVDYVRYVSTASELATYINDDILNSEKKKAKVAIVMSNPIDMTEYFAENEWTTENNGTNYYWVHDFYNILDGNGYELTGISNNVAGKTSYRIWGIFKDIEEGAALRNLHLKAQLSFNDMYNGNAAKTYSTIALNLYGTIENCVFDITMAGNKYGLDKFYYNLGAMFCAVKENAEIKDVLYTSNEVGAAFLVCRGTSDASNKGLHLATSAKIENVVLVRNMPANPLPRTYTSALSAGAIIHYASLSNAVNGNGKVLKDHSSYSTDSATNTDTYWEATTKTLTQVLPNVTVENGVITLQAK